MAVDESAKNAALWDLGLLAIKWANDRNGRPTLSRDLVTPTQTSAEVLARLFEADPNHVIFRGTESLPPEKRILAAAGDLIR